MTEKTQLPEALTNHTPWENSETPIWLSTHFSLRRNYSRYRFPQKISEIESHQVLDLIKNQLLSSSFLKEPVFLQSETLSPTDREYIIEHFNFIDGFGPASKSQGFIVDNSRCFLGMINMGDHLVLQWTEMTNDWEKTWHTLSQMELALGNSLEYAYLNRFGYLTSDTTYCGTGLTAQAFMHLPAIMQMGKAEEAFSGEIEEDIFPREMGGSEGDFVGDMIVLQNKYALGLTEDAILQSLHLSASKLKTAEETLRKHIKETDSPEMKDKISRAYGLLSHSYQLQTPEVLSALSLLKLGIYLGWVTNITDQKLNEMFFKCRRAHLLFTKDAPQEEIPHTRAEYLHSSLKEAKLTI